MRAPSSSAKVGRRPQVARSALARAIPHRSARSKRHRISTPPGLQSSTHFKDTIRAMPDSVFTLTKFDAGERQLLLAIRRFFSKEDQVSIHTLAEASGQVLYDIGSTRGAFSVVRDYEMIRPERKRDWLAVVFKPGNFFKHADKDAEDTLEFKSIFNDFSLFDAVQMHHALKKKWMPETMVFVMWFGLKYPNLIVESSDLGQGPWEGSVQAKADFQIPALRSYSAKPSLKCAQVAWFCRALRCTSACSSQPNPLTSWAWARPDKEKDA